MASFRSECVEFPPYGLHWQLSTPCSSLLLFQSHPPSAIQVRSTLDILRRLLPNRLNSFQLLQNPQQVLLVSVYQHIVISMVMRNHVVQPAGGEVDICRSLIGKSDLRDSDSGVIREMV